MYDSGPSDEELAAIGIKREDVADDSDFEIWPENWLPFQIFSRVSTQWRVGAGGPTGLDYQPVRWVMEGLGITKAKKQIEVLQSIRILEVSALEQMDKNQKGSGS